MRNPSISGKVDAANFAGSVACTRRSGAELLHQCERSASTAPSPPRAGIVDRPLPGNRPVLLCRLLPGVIEQSSSIVASVPAQHAPVTRARPSRRQVLRASLLGGIAVYIAPFGTRAFASLFEDALLTRPAWNDGVLKYRVDGISKVTGEKVFARDIRARDMPHWPQQQAHALALRVTKADRRYAGFDLALLGSDLAPDRVVTAADLARDGLDFPSFYGNDMLLGRRRDAGLSRPGGRSPDLSGFCPLSLRQGQAAVQRRRDPLWRSHRAVAARPLGIGPIRAHRRQGP